MKRYILTIVASLLLAFALKAQTGDCSSGTHSDPAGYALQNIQERIFLLESLFLEDLSADNYAKAKQLLEEIRDSAWLIASEQQAQDSWVTHNRPMRDEEFSEFRSRVQQAVFGDDQLELIKLIAQDNFFRAEQISDILRLLVFSDTQLEALEIMYPRCSDRRYSYRILDVFTFDDDKEQARQIVGGSY